MPNRRRHGMRAAAVVSSCAIYADAKLCRLESSYLAATTFQFSASRVSVGSFSAVGDDRQLICPDSSNTARRRDLVFMNTDVSKTVIAENDEYNCGRIFSPPRRTRCRGRATTDANLES